MDTKHESNDESQNTERIAVENEGTNITVRVDSSADASNETQTDDSEQTRNEDADLSAKYDKLVSTSVSDDAKSDEKGTVPLNIVPIDQPKSSFNLHKYILYTIVGGLILSALISIISVLIGEFNSTMLHALATTVSMVFHTLVLLLLVSINSKSKSRHGSLIMNILLLLTFASFVTSVFSIWEVIGSQLGSDLYQLYTYTFFASLWVQLFLKTGENLLDKPTRNVSFVTIGFTILTYLISVPIIFVHYPDTVAEFHSRAIAASLIALATTSILTTVFRQIYHFKHHDEVTTNKDSVEGPKENHTVRNVIIVCAVVFFGIPFAFGLLGLLYSSYIASNGYYANNNRTPSYDTPIRTSTPVPSETTPVYNADQFATAPDKDLNDSKTCINSSKQNIPDAKIMLFKSIDTKNERLITRPLLYPQISSSTIPYYPQTSFVDKNCAIISSSSLLPDDELYYYYSFDSKDNPNYKLSFVQKIK